MRQLFHLLSHNVRLLLHPNHPRLSFSRHPESAGRRIHCGHDIKTGFFRATPSHNDVRMTQSGRSLTEMLATLAIMGVLSIGAIAGFNYAMNKHRANELLDEARKRAYTVMTQIQLGLTLSLGEYSRYNTFAGGTFDPNVQISDNRFTLTVHNVKPTVCRRLKESVGTGTLVRKIVCSSASQGNAALFFNADGSTVDPQGQLCNAAQNTYCHYGQLCTTSGEVAGTCLDKNDSWECLSNEDCANKPNTYCQLIADANHLISGQCVLLQDGISGPGQDIQDDRNNIVFQKNSLLLGPKQNYYSARNWCLAHQKDLIDIRNNRFQCNNPSIGFSQHGEKCTAIGRETYTNDSDLSSVARQFKNSIRGNFMFSRFWTRNFASQSGGINIYTPVMSFFQDNVRYYDFDTLCE